MLVTQGTLCCTWRGSRRTVGPLWPPTPPSGPGTPATPSYSHHRILWIFSVLMIAAVMANAAKVSGGGVPMVPRDWGREHPVSGVSLHPQLCCGNDFPTNYYHNVEIIVAQLQVFVCVPRDGSEQIAALTSLQGQELLILPIMVSAMSEVNPVEVS